jgi:hypothetical protein
LFVHDGVIEGQGFLLPTRLRQRTRSSMAPYAWPRLSHWVTHRLRPRR